MVTQIYEENADTFNNKTKLKIIRLLIAMLFSSENKFVSISSLGTAGDDDLFAFSTSFTAECVKPSEG